MKNLKFKILLVLIFAFANGIIYYLTELDKKQRVDVVLDESLKSLEVSYELLLHNQKLVADAAYVSTTELTRGFTKIIKKAQFASDSQKDVLRKMLHKLLKGRYAVLKKQGVFQYQFILPNNELFLKMNNPQEYGNNLTNTRPDIKIVNLTHKPVRGFYRGGHIQAFRNIYPMFDSKNNFLGAVEISFASDSVQTYLNTKIKTHSYFLVKKHVFNEAGWQNGDVSLDYIDSIETKKEMLLTLNKSHSKKDCIIKDEIKLSSVRHKVENSIANSRKFAVHALRGTDYVDVISFYPIKNYGSDEAVAWIVSQGKSSFIYESEKKAFIIRVSAAVVFLILLLTFYKVIATKQIVEKEHMLVNDVLNSSDDIIFATNFKEVNFSNKNFLKFFDVKSNKRFNKKTKNDLLSIFMPVSGSLHGGLLKDGESFLDLVERTPKDERKISIVDDELHTKEFKLIVIKASYTNNNICLVTLRDMAKIKEVEEDIQKKAYTDSLTNLYNKNKFDEVVENELKRDARHKRDLGIAIINIDKYDEINEKHGNLIADGVVMLLAQNIKDKLRDTDIFARFGDGEFAIAFLDTSKDDVEIACNKLKDSIASLSHPIVGEIEVSFATTQHLETDTVENMYTRCDETLNKINEKLKNTFSHTKS